MKSLTYLEAKKKLQSRFHDEDVYMIIEAIFNEHKRIMKELSDKQYGERELQKD